MYLYLIWNIPKERRCLTGFTETGGGCCRTVYMTICVCTYVAISYIHTSICKTLIGSSLAHTYIFNA